MTDSENAWVLVLIQDTCPPCHALAPEWDKLMALESMTSRKIKLGYVTLTDLANRVILREHVGSLTV